jgi:cell division protein FtsB
MYRLRAMLRPLWVPLGIYSLAGLIASYFIWHGLHGQRGLKTGEEYEQRLAKLRFERDVLKLQRIQWEKRIGLIRGETVDGDIVEEQARALLGRVHKNEVVILTQTADNGAAR